MSEQIKTEENNLSRAKTQPLDNRTKWSYCVGATGRDAAYALVSMYLITYIQYTMKLTAAQFATISTIMACCLIWDAVNDPMMGIIIENAHLKSGKYRPWILMGALLNAALIVILFTVRPQGWSFVVFFGISYLLWGMTFTMNDISYWGMLPSLSSDASTRNLLVTLMSIFVCVGQFAVAGIVPTVIAGNAVNAYRAVAITVAACFVAFQLLVYFGVRERDRKQSDSKLSLKDMLKIFLRNDQLIPAGIAFFLFNIGSNLLIIFGYNFFNFEFGYSKAGNLIFIFTVMFGLGTLFSQAIFA
ncbi:MAG: MFS transporter, partial [Lachnospiraceae bacterium]|nr:MFS transporter [Lachnospiraceae bacterium]